MIHAAHAQNAAPATLIILGDLPGVGKTAIARELAHRMAAVHLRVDSIEQALRASGAVSGPLNDAGYRVAYAVAGDNLRLGLTVVADSVNPLKVTREAWTDVAKNASARALEVEVICSDRHEHRRRVESRPADIPGLSLPAWQEVIERKYDVWIIEHLVIDTAGRTIEQSVDAIRWLLDAK